MSDRRKGIHAMTVDPVAFVQVRKAKFGPWQVVTLDKLALPLTYMDCSNKRDAQRVAALSAQLHGATWKDDGKGRETR